MIGIEENPFLPLDQRSENDNEYSYTNESSNSFQLFNLQNGIVEFNDFQLPTLDLTAPLNDENKIGEKDSSKKFLLKKKGRGRQRQLINNENLKIHDKFSTDNLLRKIQVHYLSFIISILNEILEQLNFEQRFYKLDYYFKKNVNMKFVESLKQKNLGEIICNKISCKYKQENENANQIIYEEIKDNEILNNILSENYLKFFKKIYYKNNRIINLKEYGLDKDILLSKKVKLFEDLFKDNNASDKDEEYQKKINECAIQNYCQVQFIKK